MTSDSLEFSQETYLWHKHNHQVRTEALADYGTSGAKPNYENTAVSQPRKHMEDIAQYLLQVRVNCGAIMSKIHPSAKRDSYC